MLANLNIQACRPNVPTQLVIRPSEPSLLAPYREIGKQGPWFSGVGIGAFSPYTTDEDAKIIFLIPFILIDSKMLYVAIVPCLRSVSVIFVPSRISGFAAK